MKPQESTEIERSKRDEFVSSLAEELGRSVRASVVFAEPVESNGVTVIPVAKARWGFGGGTGRDEDKRGSGGGGGAFVEPIGFIEISNGAARFHRIHNISVPLLAVSGLVGLWLLRGLLRK